MCFSALNSGFKDFPNAFNAKLSSFNNYYYMKINLINAPS